MPRVGGQAHKMDDRELYYDDNGVDSSPSHERNRRQNSAYVDCREPVEYAAGQRLSEPVRILQYQNRSHPGREHVVPDAMSRLANDEPADGEDDVLDDLLVPVNHVTSTLIADDFTNARSLLIERTR